MTEYDLSDIRLSSRTLGLSIAVWGGALMVAMFTALCGVAIYAVLEGNLLAFAIIGVSVGMVVVSVQLIQGTRPGARWIKVDGEGIELPPHRGHARTIQWHGSELQLEILEFTVGLERFGSSRTVFLIVDRFPGQTFLTRDAFLAIRDSAQAAGVVDETRPITVHKNGVLHTFYR